jgi:uncharacterized membrane protein
MIMLILTIIGAFAFIHLYIRSRKKKYLLAMLFALLNMGLEILFQFFMPIELFYARLGWLTYVFHLVMLLGVFSIFWICFMPLGQKKAGWSAH